MSFLETRMTTNKENGAKSIVFYDMESFKRHFIDSIGKIECITIGGTMLDGTRSVDILKYISREAQLRNNAGIYPYKIVINETDVNTRIRARNLAKFSAPSFVEIAAIA